MTVAYRKSVLGPRHAYADRLVSLYAEHELGTVRAETWYSKTAPGFDPIIKSGRPLPEELVQEIEFAGWVVLCVRSQRRQHWETLRRVYWEREPVKHGPWRLALDAVAQIVDETRSAREPVNPT